MGAGDNGNVYGITNNLDSSRSQSFTYDPLNRVQTAQTAATWGNSYVYDPWGNLLQKNVTKGTAETLNVAVNGNNQIIGFCYDTAGNLINAGACGTTSYAYDAEARMAAAAGVSYDYDGAGQRVKKSGGSNDTLYWYGQSGEVLLETDLAGNLQNEYIFFNGQRVARHDLYDYVDFYMGDHLSSTRLDTDVYGNPLDDSDYYPFGGERVALANSSNHYKFTGLERDSESGLDHTLFRQYSSTQGRWMTPDPAGLAAADAANPQSWNRYAYAMNSPTNTTDALGLEPSWNDDLTGGGGGFGYGGLFGGDGTGYCPPAYANCDDSPFGGIGITIVFGGSPHGGDGSAPTSSTSGGSPNAPHIGGTFPNGESLGIPNGMPLRPLSIWQLLNMVPVENWCDFGPCVFGLSDNGLSDKGRSPNPVVIKWIAAQLAAYDRCVESSPWNKYVPEKPTAPKPPGGRAADMGVSAKEGTLPVPSSNELYVWTMKDCLRRYPLAALASSYTGMDPGAVF